RRPRGAPRAAPEQRQPAGTAERSIALLGRPQLVRPGLPAAAGNGLAGVRLGGTAAPPGQQLRSPAADGAAAAGLAAARAGRCALVAAAPAGADRRLAARASERRQRSPCRDVGPIIAAMLKDPFQRLGLDREVLSVSQLNGRARALLEDVFAQVWVEGEI